MNFAFTEEQEMLRATARRFLEEKAPTLVVRKLMETESGFDAGLWNDIAAQGWQAMAIPEAYGGAGFGLVEQGILMEEMGRSLFPAPFLSTVVIGADLSSISEPGAEAAAPSRHRAGELRVALAQLEATAAGCDRDRDGGQADRQRSDSRRDQVVRRRWAHRRPAARGGAHHGATGSDGVSLVIVPGDAPGVTRRRLETMDMTRKQAEIVFDGVRVPASTILGAEGEAWGALEGMTTRAIVALAYEQVGGAQKCLEMAVDYAKVRVQFGRPIGSFQAIKHKCADMLVQLESAKSAAYYAGWAVATSDPEAEIVAPMAKSYCSEAFFHCAAESIQIHGGIGFTWEHDAHLYFKRAKTDELLFGTPAQHRAVLAERLGL
jgi:alkylation response protein AidB-like acyl-CoA dehydrogenase